MKIVWICHFSTKKIRDKLPLARRGKAIFDFAPWISATSELVKEVPGLELHIISPHIGLKSIFYSFEHDGVHYHFFKADLPFIHRHWPRWFSLERASWFQKNRVLVRLLLRRIRPDLINLHGAENSYYSSTILGQNKIPILITIQGIYSNPLRKTIDRYDWLNGRIERIIHKENMYFGISAPFMPELIRRDRPDAILFWNRYPISARNALAKIAVPGDKKKYDFVFFARLVPVKGPEDLLNAFRKVVDVHPQATMKMMGLASPDYLLFLKKLVLALGLENNVNLLGGISAYDDFLREASEGKIYVLPTKIDTIPGTIIEAINLGLPVISYRTGDIPLLNSGKERVLLCEAGDINALAANMLRLFNDPELARTLASSAKAFVDKELSDDIIRDNFINQYRAIIENFRHGTPIPGNLLYENYIKDLEEYEQKR